MKRGMIVFILMVSTALSAAQITFESPKGGFTTKRVQTIKGEITGYDKNRATLSLNGIPQTIPLHNGEFELNAVVAPGNNVVEVEADGAKEKVSFYADVPKRDIKVVLTWDTPTDVDLWVIDPKGHKCYYANNSTPTGGNLDTDVTTGYGPETFTMAQAIPGSYAVQVQYYSSYSSPITRVKLYVVLYEGTSREEVKKFDFVMTRSGQVYHIADFQINPE